MRLLCALGLFLALLHVTSCLLIGAFNIQCFGNRKFDKKVTTTTGRIIKAIDIITEIVQRYDIILIQEVRCNNDLSVPDRLLALVNKGSDQFRYIVSEPLPDLDINHRERYLFLYRKGMVTKVESFQYTGNGFDRPPFVVKFSSTQTAVKEFVLIPIHASPLSATEAAKKGKKSTVEEIDALVDVVAAAEQRWKNNNIMVLGDFNAGGTYVKDGDWKDIRRLRNKKSFNWLIADNVDTAVLGSPKAYDRIVVTTEMNNRVVPRSAGVFNFRDEYDLGDQAKKISDHFPVQVELKPKEEGPEAKKRRLN